jgi:hypothetical protein
MGEQKWIAHVPLLPGGWGISFVSRCLRVSRAQLHVILRRTDDWKDGRAAHTDDTEVLRRIHHVIEICPHMVIVGYGDNGTGTIA